MTATNVSGTASATPPTIPPPLDPKHDGSGSSAETPEELGHGRILVVFAALMLAVFLAALDQTIVATALPTIVGELNGLEHISWIVTAYLLASTVVMPIYGKLGDLFGRKGVFQVAILIFLLGSALAGWSRNMEELIAFRAVQGVGAGGLMIGAQAIIADVVPPRQRGRYLGLIGGVFGLSSVIGPLLGGLLTEHASWRWCFYVNLPVGIAALFVTAAVLKLPGHQGRARLDLLGTLLLAATSTCIVLFSSWGGTRYGWDSPIILSLGVGAVVGIGLFVLVEHRAAEPIIPLRLFRDPIFSAGGLIGIVVGVAMFGAIAYLPVFLQMVDGATPTESGLLMLPMVAGLFVASVTAGRIMSATGRYKAFPILGTSIAAVGMGLLSLLDAGSVWWEIGAYMAVVGVGIGLVMPTLILAVQNSAPARDLGVATSASNYFRQIGACLGTAAFGAIFTHRLAEHLANDISSDVAGSLPDVNSLTPESLLALPPGVRDGVVAAFAEALPPVFLYAVPALAFGFLLAFVLKEKPLRSGPVATEEEPPPTGTPSTSPLAHPPADHPHGVHPIRVSIHQTEGDPVRGAVLTLVDLAGQQVARSLAAGNGRYELPTPDPGSYVLIASAHDYHPHARMIEIRPELEAPVDVEVTLNGESGVFGTVRRISGGPVTGATVTLTNPRGEVVASQRTTPEGAYTFGDLVAGSYTMAVSAPAYRPAALVVSVPKTGKVRQDVQLVGGAALFGTVRSKASRRPLPDARISLIDPTGRVVRVTKAGPDGQYRLGEVPEGEYTVVATTLPPAATTLEVSDGKDHELTIELVFPEA